MDGERGGCLRCIGFSFTLGLTALIMWLTLRPDKPTYSIVDFYVPALNKTGGDFTAIPPQNTTLAFELKINNKNKDMGIYYDDVSINVTVYQNQSSGSIVGNLTLPHFYQGHKKTATRKELVDIERVPWEVVFGEVLNGTVVFRLDLATKVRFKIFGIKTGRRSMRVGGNVTVNDDGTKTQKKHVKLQAGGAAHVCYRALVWVPIAVVWVLIW